MKAQDESFILKQISKANYKQENIKDDSDLKYKVKELGVRGTNIKNLKIPKIYQ